MLVDHILSTAGDDVIVLGFENRARREREIEGGLCDIGEEEEKKTCKICLV
jgi:hypothetical protein